MAMKLQTYLQTRKKTSTKKNSINNNVIIDFSFICQSLKSDIVTSFFPILWFINCSTLLSLGLTLKLEPLWS